MKFIFTILFLTALLESKILDYDIKPSFFKSDKYMGITILDSKELKFKGMSELSALAMRDNILYALSDKGILYKFKLKIKDKKIKKLKLKSKLKLKDENSKRISKYDRDSEGMVLVDDKLLISFERNPRVELYSLDALRIKKLKINKKLRDVKKYRSPNKALESLAYNKKYGLITAPESPLKNKKFHILYGKNNTWRFGSDGKITALEFINGNEILIMQRSFNYLTRARETVLSKIDLQSCSKNHICKNHILAKLKSEDGWRLDNFEGLTLVDKNRFLMVSDDNGGLFQKTLLVFFEINF